MVGGTGSWHRRPRSVAAGEGYSLVILLVITMVASVIVAAALPSWSQLMRRDREEELIFRGLQYAEGIRLFQQRHGRYPVSLEELLEVRPRCVRRLWEDPMSPEGEWGLVFAQGDPRGQEGEEEDPEGRRRGDRGSRNEPRRPARSRLGEPRQTGPIIGVFSRSEEDSIKTYFGNNSYRQWIFRVDQVPLPVVTPGTLNVNRPTSGWVGRPFPEGLEPVRQGGMPGGDEEGDARDPRRRP